MGTSNVLSETLFGRTRGAVLSVLYGHVGKGFYLRQLARLTDIALGPVQREIRHVAGELLFRRPHGHVTLLHSVAGLSRIALVVTDFKGIRAG
jgi:transposase-like protein